MKIVFFKTPAAFRTWLQRHHTKHRILHVGFRKRHTGEPSITWPEAVDEALCYGWIDGVRHRIDADCYTIRFTPRRPGSIWSAVNLRRVRALMRDKRMSPQGLVVYQERNRKKMRLYAYEQRKEWRFSPPTPGSSAPTGAHGPGFRRRRRGTGAHARIGYSARNRKPRG